MKQKTDQEGIIQGYEDMLMNPKLGVEEAKKLMRSMMNETRRFVDRPDKMVVESESKSVTHGLFKKENNSPSKVWSRKHLKYV